MLVALTKNETSVMDSFQRAILLAPCTVVFELTDPDLSELAMGAIGLARGRSIYSVPEIEGWTDTQELVC